MRTLAPVLLLVLTTAAQQAPGPNALAADEAVAAFRAGDRERLRALATQAESDPWSVADELCARGEHEAAEAFAQAAPGPDTARLPAYVATRRAAIPRTEDRARLRQADAAADGGDPAQALAILAQLPTEETCVLSVRVLSARAYACQRAGKRKAARDTYAETGRRAEELGWLRLGGYAYWIAASLSMATGDLRSAAESGREALRIGRLRGEAGFLVDVLLLLGTLQMGRGEMAEALAYLEQAREDAAPAGRAEVLPRIEQLLALAHARLGDRKRALRFYEQALAFAEKAGDPKQVAAVLEELASMQRSAGDLQAALASLERLRVVLTTLEDRARTARALHLLGTVQLKLDRIEEAGAAFGAARDLFEELGDRVALAETLLKIADVEGRRGGLEEALAAARQAVEVGEDTDDALLQADAYTELADRLGKVGEHGKALEASDRAIALAERVGFPETLAHALLVRSQLLEVLGEPQQALDAIRRAVDEIAHFARGLGDEQAVLARGLHAWLYAQGVRLALRTNDLETMFFFLEAGRAQALQEALGNRGALRARLVPADALAAEEQAYRRLAEARDGVREALRSDRRAAVNEARAALEEARDAVVQAHDVVQREAKAAADLITLQPVALAEAQRTLDEEDVLLVFGGDCALVVTRATARCVALSGAGRVAEACAALRSPAFRDTPPDDLIHELRELVIEPLALPDAARRWIVSPHGALTYVPFALLASGRPCAYVPSASVLVRLGDEAGRRGAGVLALGEPAGAEALPGSRAEAEAVGSLCLLGEAATKEGLRRALGGAPRWRAVHFACHALADPAQPRFSALMLAPAAGDDGRLSVLDAFGMEIPTDLAVLSACATGQGKVASGEGLIGFTRAFMVAGAPRVIVSLWPVPDEATRALMVRFYELWKPGRLPTADALRQAQADVASREGWSHPFFWAAWQLWGVPD